MEMKPAIWTGFFTGYPLDVALTMLHNCGWQYFELSTEHLCNLEESRDYEQEIEQAVAVMAESDLEMLQAHGLLEVNFANPIEKKRREYTSHLSRHIKLAAKLGVKVITVHPGSFPDISEEEWKTALKYNVDAFRYLGDLAAECDMKIGIENLFWSKVTTSRDMIAILNAIDHPATGITLDTSHANMVGINIPQMIDKLGSRIIATHISDNYGSGDDHKIPGWGTINWEEVVDALRRIHYQGLFNLEIPGERHPVVFMRRLKCKLALKTANVLLDIDNV